MLSDGLCFNFSSINMNYCEFVATLPDDTDNPNQHYHDTQYGFEKHKGYGTAAHLAALKQYGVLPEHRAGFAPVRELLEQGRLFE